MNNPGGSSPAATTARRANKVALDGASPARAGSMESKGREPSPLSIGVIARDPDAVVRIRVPANQYGDRPGYERLSAMPRAANAPLLALAGAEIGAAA